MRIFTLACLLPFIVSCSLLNNLSSDYSKEDKLNIKQAKNNQVQNSKNNRVVLQADKPKRKLAVEDAYFKGDQVIFNEGRQSTQHKHINAYTQSLAHNLVNNLEYLTTQTPLAITTFTFVDSDLNQGTLIGNHVSEALMHEFHKMRIPLIDYKLTKYIRVTPEGDFALSRDYLELDEATPVKYILTGTMVNHRHGVLINARIVGIESRAVVATGQLLLPEYAIADLMPSDSKVDGIELKK